MNANEISPKANARMNRIRIVSRIFRIPTLAMFIFLCLMLIVKIKHTAPMYFQLLADLSTGVPIYVRPLDLISDLIQGSGITEGPVLTIILIIWYWKLASLFRLYEHGLIFASETVRCIKILGLLCAAQWMLGTIHQFLFNYHLLPSLRSTLPPEVAVKLKEETFRAYLGIFPFPIWGINFGLLLAGILIILIAWIMDEGRKIQEEQELMV
jgi:hypothetical protein